MKKVTSPSRPVNEPPRSRPQKVSGRGRARTAARWALAVSILAGQMAMIVHARFDDARYFCWAPHDSQNEYAIRVAMDGLELSEEAVEARYRIPARGVDPRAIAHVTRLVEQYERGPGAGDGATVVVRYRTNGGPLRSWSVAGR